IEIAPSNPDILFVGTGESNAGGGSLAYDGFGMYKSLDGGQAWEYCGLEECGSVGRVVIHPDDPDIVYVAAMGRLFSNNPERGIFKTSDGGQTWDKILYISDSTGGIDLVLHPFNPDILYAALWERVRRPDRRSYGGNTCGIYKTVDGGDTWIQLTNGLPSPASNIGRIGIDISQSDPNILYAIYADNIGYFLGVYKTTDNGNSWTQTNDGFLSGMYVSYGWWFGRIHIDPTNPDIVYPIGLDLYKTSNGGASWENISSYTVHVDQHDLVAHVLDHEHLVLGNDGGVYISDNGGSTWNHLENLPIMQFYTCEVDEQFPERLYGGAQDMGTNRTMTGGLSDWQNIYGGDGFYVLVDPVDNNYVYAEYQYGNLGRSTNGGYSFQGATSGISYSDRKNWMTPVVFDPDNPAILYYGANRLYRSTNHAINWLAISPDLSNGPGTGNLTYGTITTIAVSPANTEYIYTGTDDGNVWVTKNNGQDWTKISSSLPVRWVTRVAADHYDENTAFVCFSGYRYDSYLPHIFMTRDAGMSWDDISGDLPEAPVNDIIVDPELDSTLYIATDFGVFVTWDYGMYWFVLGTDLPNVPIVDMRLHNSTRKLVAATYGRSMYTFDLDDIIGVEGNMTSSYCERISVYPNPFTENITIMLDLKKELAGRVDIVNLNGQVVKTLFEGIMKKNVNELIWDGTNSNGAYVNPGIYICRIFLDDQIIARKLIKMK
ncbi:MAG: T9SS type A sorting domain-containing protein, partial [Bacteroidetes bacterium]|nr:T9SS type A sorting domain-containing protein [Bacteroidota bacterium]